MRQMQWTVSVKRDGGNAELAKKQLQRLAASLNAKHPGAAASLREGLEDTLTVQALGITDRKSVV